MPVEPQSSPARRLLSEDAPPALFADALAGAKHAFFGRAGGASAGIYASLNAGPGSNDDVEKVLENRRRIAAAFAVAPERLIGVHQVHSSNAVLVDAPWPGERPRADAMVTTTSGLVLSVLSADCAPVLLADETHGVIAAAHAGWKGALSGVLASTVELMQEQGGDPLHVVAAIGPCIHQPSYEIGPEFEARFLETCAAHARFFAAGAGDRKHFDLPGFCAHQLRQAGVAHIEILAADTYAKSAAFFSHRRSVREKAPDYGRNCSAIALQG
jgi:YfiH family protein